MIEKEATMVDAAARCISLLRVLNARLIALSAEYVRECDKHAARYLAFGQMSCRFLYPREEFEFHLRSVSANYTERLRKLINEYCAKLDNHICCLALLKMASCVEIGDSFRLSSAPWFCIREPFCSQYCTVSLDDHESVATAIQILVNALEVAPDRVQSILD